MINWDMVSFRNILIIGLIALIWRWAVMRFTSVKLDGNSD